MFCCDCGSDDMVEMEMQKNQLQDLAGNKQDSSVTVDLDDIVDVFVQAALAFQAKKASVFSAHSVSQFA